MIKHGAKGTRKDAPVHRPARPSDRSDSKTKATHILPVSKKKAPVLGV